jgi:hypothetical protein
MLPVAVPDGNGVICTVTSDTEEAITRGNHRCLLHWNRMPHCCGGNRCMRGTYLQQKQIEVNADADSRPTFGADYR